MEDSLATTTLYLPSTKGLVPKTGISLKKFWKGLVSRFFPERKPPPTGLTNEEYYEYLERTSDPARGGIIGSVRSLITGKPSLPIHGKWVGPLYSANVELKPDQKLSRVDLEIEPEDSLDALAKMHDIQYSIASGIANDKKRNEAYRKADDLFVKRVDLIERDYYGIVIDALLTVVNLYSVYSSALQLEKTSGFVNRTRQALENAREDVEGYSGDLRSIQYNQRAAVGRQESLMRIASDIDRISEAIVDGLETIRRRDADPAQWPRYGQRSGDFWDRLGHNIERLRSATDIVSNVREVNRNVRFSGDVEDITVRGGELLVPEREIQISVSRNVNEPGFNFGKFWSIDRRVIAESRRLQNIAFRQKIPALTGRMTEELRNSIFALQDEIDNLNAAAAQTARELRLAERIVSGEAGDLNNLLRIQESNLRALEENRANAIARSIGLAAETTGLALSKLTEVVGAKIFRDRIASGKDHYLYTYNPDVNLDDLKMYSQKLREMGEKDFFEINSSFFEGILRENEMEEIENLPFPVPVQDDLPLELVLLL